MIEQFSLFHRIGFWGLFRLLSGFSSFDRFFAKQQNSRAGFQALMSYHAAVCPMTCQPGRDGDIWLRSLRQLRPPDPEHSSPGMYLPWSAVFCRNRFLVERLILTKWPLAPRQVNGGAQVELWLWLKICDFTFGGDSIGEDWSAGVCSVEN